MKVCLNGKLVPVTNLMKIAGIRYGVGKLNVFERAVYKTECGRYVQVNTIGNNWLNRIIKMQEVTPKMICDLLEGQDIDKETEEVLLKEHLVEVVECPTKS